MVGIGCRSWDAGQWSWMSPSQNSEKPRQPVGSVFRYDMVLDPGIGATGKAWLPSILKVITTDRAKWIRLTTQEKEAE